MMCLPLFRNPARTILTVIILSFAHASAQTQILRLTLTNPNDLFDETVIAFAASATDSVDPQYDTPKARDSSEILLYSKIDTGAYSRQVLSLLKDDRAVSLGIDAAISGMHRLRLASVENLDETVCIILEDTGSGISVNLRKNQDYWLNLSAGSGIERLRLHFNPPLKIFTTDGSCNNAPSVLQIVQLGSYTWNYEIKDADNAVIDAGIAWNGINILTGIPTGSYIISLTDPYGYWVEKSVSVIAKEMVVARFQVSDSIVPVNKPVLFYDYSIGAMQYRWDFGDGEVLTGNPFPSKVFTEPGTYNVRFTAANDDCNDVATKMIQVADNTTGSNIIDTESLKVYSAGTTVHIDFKRPGAVAHVEVFNSLGQCTFREELPATGRQQISLPCSSGFCLVRVSSGGYHAHAWVFLR